MAEPLLLPHWGQGSKLFAVTKAGSGMPCGEGLFYLWDLDGGEREPRGGVGPGEGRGLSRAVQSDVQAPRAGHSAQRQPPGSVSPSPLPPSSQPLT